MSACRITKTFSSQMMFPVTSNFSLSRLVDLLTPSMAAEEEPLARRKQELLLNNVSNAGRYYAGAI